MRHSHSNHSRHGIGGAGRALSGAAALGGLGKRLSSVDALKIIRLLRSGDPEMRQNAINTLARYGGRDTIIHIARCLHDANIKVRVEACNALGEMRAHDSKAKLYDALGDKDPFVVCAAASALVCMGDKQGLPAVARLVFSDGPHRSEAIRTLNKLTRQDFRANERGIKDARKWIRRKKDEIFD